MTFGAGGQRSNPLSYGRIVAERAGFEPAEEREPLAGLANRCLGPLDYLSKQAFYRPQTRFAKGDRCEIPEDAPPFFRGARTTNVLTRRRRHEHVRRGRDSNPRGLLSLPVFKTGGFVRSPTPPKQHCT